jgi:uncharacterized membrane protein YraQ (UPF0718 family)
MRQLIDRLGKNSRQAAIGLFLIAVIFWVAYVGSTGDTETVIKSQARAFTLVLWSILLEALPFVLLGTLISSLIQVFVSDNTIIKLLPKNKLMQLIIAALLGVIFPICECAIIPITRGLIKKGLPVGPAITFMTAVPIVNPVVIFSTYSAFSGLPQMALFRTLFGFLAALLIGFIAGRNQTSAVLKGHAMGCNCGHHVEAHDLHESHAEHKKEGSAAVLKRVLWHTTDELKSVGAYLIFGALIASVMQLWVNKSLITGIGSGQITSILVMMLLAFMLSLCSEADAFVASTFLQQFSAASVLAFLITGPMIDIKNTMMLVGGFQKRFVLRVILTILIACFGLALAASLLGIGGGQR